MLERGDVYVPAVPPVVIFVAPDVEFAVLLYHWYAIVPFPPAALSIAVVSTSTLKFASVIPDITVTSRGCVLVKLNSGITSKCADVDIIVFVLDP